MSLQSASELKDTLLPKDYETKHYDPNILKLLLNKLSKSQLKINFETQTLLNCF